MNAMVTILIGALLNIVLNWILIIQFEVMGAVIATYTSWMLVSVIRIIDVKRYFPFDINMLEFCILSLINFAQCVLVLMLPTLPGVIVSLLLQLVALWSQRELVLLMIRSSKNKVLSKLKK